MTLSKKLSGIKTTHNSYLMAIVAVFLLTFIEITVAEAEPSQHKSMTLQVSAFAKRSIPNVSEFEYRFDNFNKVVDMFLARVSAHSKLVKQDGELADRTFNLINKNELKNTQYAIATYLVAQTSNR